MFTNDELYCHHNQGKVFLLAFANSHPKISFPDRARYSHINVIRPGLYP